MSKWVERAAAKELPVSDRTGQLFTRPTANGEPTLATSAHKYTAACLQGTCTKEHSR